MKGGGIIKAIITFAVGGFIGYVAGNDEFRDKLETKSKAAWDKVTGKDKSSSTDTSSNK